MQCAYSVLSLFFCFIGDPEWYHFFIKQIICRVPPLKDVSTASKMYQRSSKPKRAQFRGTNAAASKILPIKACGTFLSPVHVFYLWDSSIYQKNRYVPQHCYEKGKHTCSEKALKRWPIIWHSQLHQKGTASSGCFCLGLIDCSRQDSSEGKEVI